MSRLPSSYTEWNMRRSVFDKNQEMGWHGHGWISEAGFNFPKFVIWNCLFL